MLLLGVKLSESLELRHLLGLMTICCSGYSLFNAFSVILGGGVGRNGSTVAVSDTTGPADGNLYYCGCLTLPSVWDLVHYKECPASISLQNQLLIFFLNKQTYLTECNVYSKFLHALYFILVDIYIVTID